ncbi:hypothetical protein [Paenibacillus rhizovicinus]|nr:hypothetical protein [Paenibacillus rhizovicinus]
MILLFFAAALSLELLEGSKITTSEYYGLRNIGLVFVFLIVLEAVLCASIMVPISILISKFVKAAFGRVLLYFIFGLIGGSYMFNHLYNESYVREFDLNISTAILLFGAVGILYALIDQYLQQHAERWANG